MARSKTPATPAVTSTDVTHLLATAKPSSCGEAHAALVTRYGEAVADRFATSGCKRLPRHSVTEAKGHVSAKPRGLMTSAERKRASLVTSRPKAAEVASKVVTVGGAKVRVFADGRTEVVTPAAPKELVIREVAEVVTERVVAAPVKATHASRPKADPTATGAIRRASRRPKTEPVAARVGEAVL